MKAVVRLALELLGDLNTKTLEDVAWVLAVSEMSHEAVMKATPKRALEILGRGGLRVCSTCGGLRVCSTWRARMRRSRSWRCSTRCC